MKIDITDIPFDDQSFDIILCSHVLEHIEEDRKAMEELFRVLRVGGHAILLVPVDPGREKTYEDPQIRDPKEREAAFGQDDHVRIYGRDYVGRLEEAGFEVHCNQYAAELGDTVVRRSALSATETIYCCRRYDGQPTDA